MRSSGRAAEASQVGDRQDMAHWRLRAASLGFVVMASAEATARILADGPEHRVHGHPIRVHMFHRHGARPGVDGEAEEAGSDAEAGKQELPDHSVPQPAFASGGTLPYVAHSNMYKTKP